jgi:amidase
VPLLLKDLGPGGQLHGSASHRGNRALKDAGHVHRGIDSHIVRRWRDAGFVIVGKTNTPELGLMPTTEPEAHGSTCNPWDPTRSPGGSSGGSAAAVAAGLVPVAGASDGGGSIRIPASACGLVGLKVSRGRVSAGPYAAGDGRSVEHCVARTVRDVAGVLDVLAGAEPGDPVVAPAPRAPFGSSRVADPGRLRVAISTDSALGTTVDPEVVAATEAAGRALEDLGHVLAVDAPAALGETEVGLGGIMVLHAASTAAAVDKIAADLGREVGPDDFEARTWEHAQLGRAFTGVQVVAAQELVVAWTRRVAAFFAEHDLLVTPTLGTVPPPLGWLAGNAPDVALRMVEFAPFCAAWNWTGQPAISLPLGTSSEGLPIGVQLVAAYGREDLLLQVASQLEEACPWRDRIPPLHASRRTTA